MSSSTSAPEAPRVIDGRYRLLTPLGEGGMSIVYQAEHVFTGRHVAVKLLWPRLADSPDAVRHFLKEARSAARITHPYCVNILDMGQEADGTLYLVQELLTGIDLRRHLQSAERLPLKDAFAIALPILETLAAAHAQGVIHRDVKPANIFLCTAPGTEGQVGMVPKLIDFGIAKVAELDLAGTTPAQTEVGIVLGTPAYMAPEQLRGDKHLDGRADLWSMAVVLYEMLAGKPPFVADNIHMSAMKILCERAPPLDTRVEGIPTGVVAAVTRALEPDRTQRWPSIEEFHAALVRGLEESTIIALAPAPLLLESIATSGPTAPAAASLLSSSPSPPEEPPTATSRVTPFEPFEEEMSRQMDDAPPSRRWLLVIFGIALGLMVFGAWYGWSTRDTSGENRPDHAPSTSAPPSVPERSAPLLPIPPAPSPQPAPPAATEAPLPKASLRTDSQRRRSPKTPAAPPPPSPGPPAIEEPHTRPLRGTNDAPILE